MTLFGLGIYVFEATGLASATTFIMLLGFLPGLLLSPLTGVLADRYDRRLLMILGDSLSALGVLLILICMIRGEAQLWQIGVGVTISSVFSSLIEPSFRATISDLLTKDEYSKASGLVQLIGSAKFLISPLVAGMLLSFSDIKLILIIDICTIFLTVAATFFVRRGLARKLTESRESFVGEFRAGWEALTKNRGVFILTVSGIAICFFLGCIQSLYTPMVLGFTNSKVLGITTTICASGMLFSSLIIGIMPIKKKFTKILSLSLFMSGLCMVGFGSRENIVIICLFGFFFFAMLPFANTSIDYLIRISVPNQVQGRVWGLIGIISQLGYIIAYEMLGPLADYGFVPLLTPNGALANSVGKIIGTGNGRGIGLLIIVSGILLAVSSIILYQVKSIHMLEKDGEYVQETN